MSNVSLWFLIPLTCIALMGMLINAYILLVVLFSRQYTTVNNLLLLHLGALNLCLGGTFLFFSAPGLAHDAWLADGGWCHLHGFLFTILHPLILWTVCGLNADRYYAIAAPLHYGHLVNPRKVFLCLAVGWTISLALTTFPFFHVAPFAFNRGLGACVPNFQSGRTTLWYSAAYTAFTLLLPITLIICCNVKILLIARYHRHRIASAIYEVTLSAQVTITHQRNPFFVPTVTAPTAGGPKFRSRSPVATVLQLLGSFVLLYVPYYSIILWESCVTFLEPATDTADHVVLYQIVLALLTLAPTVNGFLYGLRNKHLRKTFQHFWRKQLTKNEVNQEIQARTPSTCGSRRQSLTPLGFFARPNLQRRLSEALLDVRKEDVDQSKIKCIASEQTWRPQCQSEVVEATGAILRVPAAEISECNAAEDEGGDAPVRAERKRSFLQKFFACDESRAPKILITRAVSDDDYTKSARDACRHSTLAVAKWYHHSDYDIIDDRLKDAQARLLVGTTAADDDEDDDDDDEEEDNEHTYNSGSENSSGLYMNLDSFDTLRTQSCDIDTQDIEQIEALGMEFAMHSSYEDELELRSQPTPPPTHRIGNGALTLTMSAKELRQIDAVRANPSDTAELRAIVQQEVVL